MYNCGFFEKKVSICVSIKQKLCGASKKWGNMKILKLFFCERKERRKLKLIPFDSIQVRWKKMEEEVVKEMKEIMKRQLIIRAFLKKLELEIIEKALKVLSFSLSA